MRQHNTLVLIAIGILALFCALVVLQHDFRINLGPIQFEREGMRLGLDLQGGTRLVLQANMAGVPDNERDDRIKGVQNVIERRVNAYGVSEPIVQILGQDRVLVELAGIRDIEQAKTLIGNTARLDFREQVQNPDGTTDWVIAKGKDASGVERELTGQYFKKAEVGFDQTTRSPIILFEFNEDGAKIFAEITQRLVGKPLGIFLDNQLISSPVVQTPILEGRGQITGRFTLQEARDLVIQLNAGALPVPVTIIEERTVDATLGSDSVRKSVIAGGIGLAAVAAFMLALYRVPGIMAVLALAVYVLLNLAIYKLWPITLTLAGIAGFILSIGMAVDANILVFERMREELRAGKTVLSAMEAGFERAWSSIRDSNVSTLITCAILAWFGSNFGASIIVGFAVTLAIGVVVSMFSAIVVTRALLRALARAGAARRPELFGVPQAVAHGAPAAAGSTVAAPGIGR